MRVFNATSHIIELHAPSLGSEGANAIGSLSGSWLTGWIADWLGHSFDRATQELTTGAMLVRNTNFMYGTHLQQNASGAVIAPFRPWPGETEQGEPLRAQRWISILSPLTLSQILEDGTHAEDYELFGAAGAIALTPSPFPNGYSDGLVSWPSQAGICTDCTRDLWYAQGQHDQAAVATGYSYSQGNNHHHSRLGAAAGGRWRPTFFQQEASYYAPGIAPPIQSPYCFSPDGLREECYSWPYPSAYHGVAVAACPDTSYCKYNQTRGTPIGGDEAFWVSAFVQARAASYCGPPINYVSVWNGQYQTLYLRQYAGPGLANPYWQAIGTYLLYDNYAPQAGLQVCNWAC